MSIYLQLKVPGDETAAAGGKERERDSIQCNFLQIDLHTLYGGVVPEIASRKHIEKINQVIESALLESGLTLENMDAIGVTYGPGTGGSTAGWSGRGKGVGLCSR